MESKFVQLNRVQLCSSCGRKIPRGMNAVVVPEENLFFCNSECLLRDFSKLEDNDKDEYD